MISLTGRRISLVAAAAGAALVLALFTPTRGQAAVRVVTTTTDLAAIAREVGGDRVEVTSIAVGHQDPHFVDVKPSILVKLRRADLFVEVGLELELGWAPSLLANSRNAAIQPGGPGFVDASEGIARLKVIAAADRSAGDIHAQGNPHYWLDPENGHQIAANIERGLSRVDPAGAAIYARNRQAFAASLDRALERWRQQAEPLRGRAVVAYHDSWPYFEQRFGFRVVDFVEPKPGIPPSGRYVAELAERMKRDGVKAILMSTFYDQKTAELVAKLADARVVTLANSVGGLAGIDGYLDLFDYNLSQMLSAGGE